ncbi:MAG TPA: hypothetical protein VMZ01_01475 [Aestuariivirga sp.]|nr:hypothetical protein [Aestuariivirga sp.]
MRLTAMALAAMVLGVSAAFAGSTPLKGTALEAARANQIISAGQSSKDAEKLFLGARMLFKLAADPAAKTPASRNIDALLDEARGLAKGNDELIQEIDALKRAQPVQAQCNWQWLCGANGCAWAQAC